MFVLIFNNNHDVTITFVENNRRNWVDCQAKEPETSILLILLMFTYKVPETKTNQSLLSVVAIFLETVTSIFKKQSGFILSRRQNSLKIHNNIRQIPWW